MVEGAAALLERHRGRIGIGELSEQLGYGRQHVHREVARHLGLPPQTLARLLRFRAAAAASGGLAGATIERPVAPQHGTRAGWILDPFGHRWNIQSVVAELSADELREEVGDSYQIT
ncbi:hypothetical protein KZZ52_58795 [Dactylosporangium sp. AC04546]|uniref:hypothetical protein n=1 Tax=Dactylosporangium sp. AC04546 TaxID=2862460 RepID=UPI001EDF9A50|nr:hypothetical protein [Dactylosporangium sp. AC04546]WVK83641.1 hypothetical protein KZZ52_58795 [Dactylosporangium sp. AC04546]